MRIKLVTPWWHKKRLYPAGTEITLAEGESYPKKSIVLDPPSKVEAKTETIEAISPAKPNKAAK